MSEQVNPREVPEIRMKVAQLKHMATELDNLLENDDPTLPVVQAIATDLEVAAYALTLAVERQEVKKVPEFNRPSSQWANFVFRDWGRRR